MAFYQGCIVSPNEDCEELNTNNEYEVVNILDDSLILRIGGKVKEYSNDRFRLCHQFVVKDYVKCISSDLPNLTLGLNYRVKETDDTKIKIYNDDGVVDYYESKDFRPVTVTNVNHGDIVRVVSGNYINKIGIVTRASSISSDSLEICISILDTHGNHSRITKQWHRLQIIHTDDSPLQDGDDVVVFLRRGVASYHGSYFHGDVGIVKSYNYSTNDCKVDFYTNWEGDERLNYKVRKYEIFKINSQAFKLLKEHKEEYEEQLRLEEERKRLEEEERERLRLLELEITKINPRIPAYKPSTVTFNLYEQMKRGFSYFNFLPPEHKCEQINLIHYIESLARNLEKDLSDINLFDIIPNNNNVFICTEDMVNKIILDLHSPPKEHIYKLLDEEQTKKVNQLYNSSVNSRRNTLKQDIEYYRIEREKLYQNAYDYQEKIKKAGTEIESLGSLVGNIDSEINKIIADPKYQFHDINSQAVRFITTKDVILEHIIPAANINYKLNFGKFIIGIYLKTFKVQLARYKDNITCGQFFHPHFNKYGDPCLGNLAQVYNDARSNGDLLTVMNIINKLLYSYNADDPYKPIESFAASSGQFQVNDSSLIGQETPDDVLYYCSSCDYEYYESHYDGADCPECDSYNEPYDY